MDTMNGEHNCEHRNNQCDRPQGWRCDEGNQDEEDKLTLQRRNKAEQWAPWIWITEATLLEELEDAGLDAQFGLGELKRGAILETSSDMYRYVSGVEGLPRVKDPLPGFEGCVDWSAVRNAETGLIRALGAPEAMGVKVAMENVIRAAEGVWLKEAQDLTGAPAQESRTYVELEERHFLLVDRATGASFTVLPAHQRAWVARTFQDITDGYSIDDAATDALFGALVFSAYILDLEDEEELEDAECIREGCNDEADNGALCGGHAAASSGHI